MGFLCQLRDSGAMKTPGGKGFAVLMALYSHRNNTGHAFPGQALLAQETGTERTTVRRTIAWGVSHLGIRKRKWRRGYIYYLPLKLTNLQISRIQAEAGLIDLNMGNMLHRATTKHYQ
jgi:hypothetical protein